MIPLWVHPVVQLGLALVAAAAFRRGVARARSQHVILGWCAVVGLAAGGILGSVAQWLAGYSPLEQPHGWFGLILVLFLARQAWLGRKLRRGDESVRSDHRTNARVVILILLLQVASGIYYSTVVL